MDLISQVTLLGGVCDRASPREAAIGRRGRPGAARRRTRARRPRPLRPAHRRGRHFVRRTGSPASCRIAARPTTGGGRRRPRRHCPRSRSRGPGGWTGACARSSSRTGATCRPTMSPGRSPRRCARSSTACATFRGTRPWRSSTARSAPMTSPRQRCSCIAEQTKGRGRRRICEVAAAVTGQCANPFEAVLYAQALLIPGLERAASVPGAGAGYDADTPPRPGRSRARHGRSRRRASSGTARRLS